MANHTPVPDSTKPRRALAWRFGLIFATIGLCVGLLEAGLFYWIPRATGLAQPDVRYVIWFLTPIVDLAIGALLGVILGLVGGLAASQRRSVISCVFAALGFGLVGAYVAWLLDWFRIGAGVIFPERLEARTPVEWFSIVFIAAFVSTTVFGRGTALFQGRLPPRRHRWLAFLLIVPVVSAGGIVFYATHRPFSRAAAMARPGSQPVLPVRPNVVLMVLDTVRADHLSCYGYSRPTTPNIDRIAKQGVQFENVIAPSSWTLPSITSILTGLAPHQSGADWGRALNPAPWTLARILASKGYETAGFNTNPFYGLGGWGLADGFSVYEDDSDSIRHNLAVTFVGQSVLRWLYDRLVRYNQFDRRDAGDVSRDVERWARHRDPSKPYFLFINYMDAHRPYLPPAPFDRRFGRIPPGLLSRLTQPLIDGRPHKPYTRRDRTDLVDGYDNSLAYLDLEVGRLTDFLKRQPGGSNTFFILTSDHGEGFGEHGTYDHGWNLYGDVLRVPLVIAGPRVPAGLRVAAVVSNREVFATVLDLTLGLKGAIALASLRNCWKNHRTASPRSNRQRLTVATTTTNDAVISELDIFGQGADPASLSLTTPTWHLILNSGGRAELYDWRSDPQEERNIAGDPQLHEVVAKLDSMLEARVVYSLLPWRALDYLSPLNEPGQSFVERISRQHPNFPAGGLPIGSAQAVFSRQPPSELVQPPPAVEDVLRTLPYH